jgi:hypothetical protein
MHIEQGIQNKRGTLHRDNREASEAVLDLIHQLLDDYTGHGVKLLSHRFQLPKGVGFLPVPRCLITPADLTFKQAQGIAPAINELENLVDVDDDSLALHHHLLDIRVAVKAPGGDPHDDVGDLPPCIPVGDDVH